MVNLRDIKEVFLSVLGDDSDRDKINKGIGYFQAGDWENLYGLAAKSGLFPIFYIKLSSLNLTNIPAEFLSRLKNIYFINLKRNTLLEQELLRVCAYLKELNIPVMPLKGPTLARYLYNDLGLRRASCDLDLLVKYETMSNVWEKLAELGYLLSGFEYKRDFLCPVNVSRRIEQVTLTKNIGKTWGINLDLHWCIRGFFTDSSIQQLWQEARYFALDGREILMLSNEDTLINLGIISISTSEEVQLKYFYDMHRLVTVFREVLDWDRLLQKVRHLNLENCLYFPLKLSADLFFTRIPERFLNKIRPNRLIGSIIGFWINKRAMLEFKQKVQYSFFLRCLLARFLYSSSLIDFIRKSFRRISQYP